MIKSFGQYGVAVVLGLLLAALNCALAVAIVCGLLQAIVWAWGLL